MGDALSRIDPDRNEFLLFTRLEQVGDGYVEVKNLKNRQVFQIPADYVVLAMGVRSVNHLADQLKGRVTVCTVGDAVKSGTIADACHSAYQAAKTIQ